MNKPEWRQHLLQLLQKRNAKDGRANDDTADLNAHLRAFLLNEKGIWAAYSAIAHEPRVDDSLQTSSQICWVFPIVVGDQLRWFTKGPKGMQQGAFGIWEPVQEGAKEYQSSELSGALVPGLGFDRKGTRLGWGKGFYDKAFSNASQNLKKELKLVGVAWSEQVVDELPRDDHDLQMQFLITEKGIQEIGEV